MTNLHFFLSIKILKCFLSGFYRIDKPHIFTDLWVNKYIVFYQMYISLYFMDISCLNEALGLLHYNMKSKHTRLHETVKACQTEIKYCNTQKCCTPTVTIWIKQPSQFHQTTFNTALCKHFLKIILIATIKIHMQWLQ